MLDQERLNADILIVDDEQANVDLLEMSLQRTGYTHLRSTTDPRRVVGMVREQMPDLVLLDLLMPHLDGFAVMEQLRALVPPDDYVPILVLTADATSSTRLRALAAGANDFLTKPFDQVELALRIKNLLETRLLYVQSRRQYALMERLYLEAQETGRQRDEAQITLSHDLGQPVAALRVATRLLRNEAASSEQDREALLERLELVESATSRVLAMTGELMDLARLQRGQSLDLHLRSTDLVALVQSEVEAHRAMSTLHTLRVEAEQPGLVADVDAPRLSRVIANLLANAIKYSPEGGEVRVRVRVEDDDLVRSAVIEVEDEGAGIPAAELERIGEQFFRASNVAGRIKGTGVGVLSARRIVEEHGGSLRIESTEGAGTRVIVHLPLE
jgi:signal transduction histidine kinase